MSKNMQFFEVRVCSKEFVFEQHFASPELIFSDLLLSGNAPVKSCYLVSVVKKMYLPTVLFFLINKTLIQLKGRQHSLKV